jgi:preprotein translocase subunit SecG
MAVLYFFQFLSAFAVVILILLHSPKGEGFGAIGGQSSLFSATKGLDAGLDRLTYLFGTLFIVMSILVAVLSI